MKFIAEKAVSEKVKAICIWQIPGLGDYIKEMVDDYLSEKEGERETD